MRVYGKVQEINKYLMFVIKEITIIDENINKFLFFFLNAKKLR